MTGGRSGGVLDVYLDFSEVDWSSADKYEPKRIEL